MHTLAKRTEMIVEKPKGCRAALLRCTNESYVEEEPPTDFYEIQNTPSDIEIAAKTKSAGSDVFVVLRKSAVKPSTIHQT
jgi:hypothetical protein